MANRMVVSIIGDNKQLRQTLADTKKQLNEQTKGIENMATKMSAAGAKMTRYITLPILGLGVAAVKSGADFDNAMTKSLAIMSDVTPQIRAQMEETARDVVNYTEFSSTQAAQAYFYLASAGLDAAQSIKALPNVAKFAQAGNFDLALATDLLTDAQSALGLTIRDDVIKNMENMVKVSDVLVKANTLSNATVQQFSEALTTRAGAALRLVNKDMEEGVAVLAAWADQGVKGAEAGTRLDIVLRDLQRASINNREKFDELGISVYDANGNMNNLADIIGDMEIAFSGMSDEQLRSTLMLLGFQDRSIAATASLLGMSDAVKGYETKLREATGYTEDVATKQMESFTAQINQLKNMAVDAGIDIFEVLLPALENVFGSIKEGIEWFKGLTDEQKKLLITIAGIVAIAGPAVLVIGNMTRAVLTLRTAFILANTAAKGLIATTSLITAVAGAMYGIGKAGDYAADKIGNYYLKEVARAALPHAAFVGQVEQMIKVIKLLSRGVIDFKDLLGNKKEVEEFIDSIDDNAVAGLGMASATAKMTDTAKEYNDMSVIQQATFQDNESLLKSLQEQYGFTREEALEYAEAEGLLREETDDTTDAFEDQRSEIDKLRGAFNDLINDIFGVVNVENALEEAEWALTEAREEAQKALKEHGEESIIYQKKLNIVDDELQNYLVSLFDVYTQEGISLERKEELREKIVEIAEEVQRTTGLSKEDFMEMAEQFSISAGDIMLLADELGYELDELERERLIKIEAEAEQAKKELRGVKFLLDQIQSNSVTITSSYAYSTVKSGFKEGGIIPQASQGLMLPSFDTGGVLAMLHPPEIVLNAKQAMQALWNMANQPITGSGGGSITNKFYLNDAVIREEADIRKVATELYNMQKTSLAGGGIR